MQSPRLIALSAIFLITFTGCGYHQVGAATHLPPNVRTLAVPIFATRVQAYHTEVAFTQAVIRELNTRTKYRILNSDSPDADATLHGTILTEVIAPLTYDASSGETSSYLITLTAKVLLTARDGRVLYENDNLLYHEQYQSTLDLSGFIQEGSPAITRMARDFATAIVSDMLESFSPMASLKSFAATDRFIAEIATPQIKPGYVLLGDEIFLYDRCRKAVQTLAPPETRDFCLHDLDLADTSIFDILDQAQTPSLMAPFQVFFIRNLKNLYGRGSKKEEFAAIDQYFRSPNPAALLIFVADHLRIPTDLRKMDYQDKERYERIRDTLGDFCGLVELARVDENDAIRWVTATAESRNIKFDPDAARELVDALGSDMMLIASEFEKLLLYVTAPAKELSIKSVILSEGGAESKDLLLPSSAGASALARNRVTLGDVETMVLAAKQRSLYELTDAISLRDRPRALALLHGLLNASDGGEDAAIGHLYMLARTFRQMLIISEKNVRDSRAIWAVLWQGFRMPPFAADDLIKQARRYKSRRDLTRALRLVARADLELRSSPANKLLVLERLILDLSTEPKPTRFDPTLQFAIEL